MLNPDSMISCFYFTFLHLLLFFIKYHSYWSYVLRGHLLHWLLIMCDGFRKHPADCVSSWAADHQAPGIHGNANNATSCSCLQRLIYTWYTSSCPDNSPTRWLTDSADIALLSLINSLNQYQFIIVMLKVNTFVLDIKCYLVLLIIPLSLYNIFNVGIVNNTALFFLRLGYDYKCHNSPRKAHWSSSCWFSSKYITQTKLFIMPRFAFSSGVKTFYSIQTMVVWTISHLNVQESSEEKTQQLKERLSRLFEANERRCSRRVLYGSDLVQACTLTSEPGLSALTAGGWRWVGRESCLRAQRTCVATTSALQSTLLSVEDRLEAANSLIKRYFSSVLKSPLFYAARYLKPS